MGIDFKSFQKVLPHVTRVKKPVLMRGRHGIGKSQMVYQFAKTVKMKVVERRASQMTEGDLIGLPSIEGNRTKWNPPDWYKVACEEAVVLFFDEIDRAVTEVRQGFFELTDSRKLNGWTLHPDTLIFAAVNGGIHGSQYQVGEMDPAELDRWTVFDLEPSVEDFLDYAKNVVHPITWDFLNTNRNHIEHKTENEPNKVYPSRRSWERYDECLTQAEMLGKDKSETKKYLSMIYDLGCGFIGMEGSVQFRDFVDKYDRQVSIDDIFTGKMDKLKGLPINDHIALIDKIIASGRAKTTFTKKEADNLAEYAKTLPGEAYMKLFRALGVESVENTIALHSRCKDFALNTINGEEEKKKEAEKKK